MTSLTQCGKRLVAPIIRNTEYIPSSLHRQFFSTYTSSHGQDEDRGVMIKGDIINMVSEEFELSKAQSTRIVNSIFDTIVEEVANDTKVSINGFGFFQRVLRKERNGRNPNTGEAITIPASKRVKFSAYKSFKETVNDSNL